MLGVRSVDLHHVVVPLRKPIRHASFARSESDNFVVRVTLANGTVGYGEGVPRAYVTGETIESAFASLGSFDLTRALGPEPGDFATAVRQVGRIMLPETTDDPRGMAGNSARAALELALLDAYGRAFGQSVGAAVRLAVGRDDWLLPPGASTRYSGAITAESRRGETVSAWKMRGLRVWAGQGQGGRRRARRRRPAPTDQAHSWSPGPISGSTPTRPGQPMRWSIG